MRFDAPVGTAEERAGWTVWPGNWFDATGYGRATVLGYVLKHGYHTGADLNLANYGDSGQPVYAAADGVVVFAKMLPAPWLGLVVIKHDTADGPRWTRYGHMSDVHTSAGDLIRRGAGLGRIGDFGTPGPADDHLHFDVATLDLGAAPTDWPARDINRLLRDYLDPLQYIRAHHADDAPAPTPPMTYTIPGDYIATGRGWSNVRQQPSTTAPIVRAVSAGATVRVEQWQNGWGRVRHQVGGAPALEADGKTEATGWIAGSVLRPLNATGGTPGSQTPAEPPVASGNGAVLTHPVIGVHPALPARAVHQRLGVHMLTVGKPLLQDYIDAGCPSFTCMDNVAAAREARAAGCAVIYRRFIQHGSVPDPRDFVRFMGLGRDDTLMVMGVNEADSISTSDIERRFEWDKKFSEAVWEFYPRCFPLIGSFSMGTPQIENPDMARRVRETYGAFLNANRHRAGLNYHSYTERSEADWPPFDRPVIADEWLAERWLKWGYDPAYVGLHPDVVMTGDETGSDVGSKGGWPAIGHTHETVRDKWWAKRKALHQRYPSLYVQNLFQGVPDYKSWLSFSVHGYLPVLREIWRGAA